MIRDKCWQLVWQHAVATKSVFREMAKVFIPPNLRYLTDGAAIVEASGTNVRQLVESLDNLHPGVAAKLIQDDRLKPGLSVVVDSRMSSLGLRESVGAESEVQFLPSISGG